MVMVMGEVNLPVDSVSERTVVCVSAGSLVCGRDHCRACNEIPKDRAVTDRDSLTVTHSLARSPYFKSHVLMRP